MLQTDPDLRRREAANMANVFFWVTYIALWALVLLLFAAVFFLYRHHGKMLLDSKEGRVSQGPELYKQFPSMRVRDMSGNTILLGRLSPQPIFIFFAQTTCKPCQEARAALAAFASKHQQMLETVLVCTGKVQEITEFAVSLPDAIRLVPDPHKDLLVQLRISSTPFAVILDQEGTVRGKGMPVTSEAFEWFVEQLEHTPEPPSVAGFVPTESISTRAR
jgi:hypothetical protein